MNYLILLINFCGTLDLLLYFFCATSINSSNPSLPHLTLKSNIPQLHYSQKSSSTAHFPKQKSPPLECVLSYLAAFSILIKWCCCLTSHLIIRFVGISQTITRNCCERATCHAGWKVGEKNANWSPTSGFMYALLRKRVTFAATCCV